MFNKLSLAVTASLIFIGCGGGSGGDSSSNVSNDGGITDSNGGKLPQEKPQNPSSSSKVLNTKTILVERGNVLNAEVIDANGQIAAGNGPKYTFKNYPTVPIIAKPKGNMSFIDFDKDNKAGADDYVFDIELKSCNEYITPISTLIAIKTNCDAQKLATFSTKMAQELDISELDLLKPPSLIASQEGILATNAVFIALVKQLFDNESIKMYMDLLKTRLPVFNAMNAEIEAMSIAGVQKLPKGQILFINNYFPPAIEKPTQKPDVQTMTQALTKECNSIGGHSVPFYISESYSFTCAIATNSHVNFQNLKNVCLGFGLKFSDVSTAYACQGNLKTQM